jgi:hypothetical protein
MIARLEVVEPDGSKWINVDYVEYLERALRKIEAEADSKMARIAFRALKRECLTCGGAGVAMIGTPEGTWWHHVPWHHVPCPECQVPL